LENTGAESFIQTAPSATGRIPNPTECEALGCDPCSACRRRWDRSHRHSTTVHLPAWPMCQAKRLAAGTAAEDKDFDLFRRHEALPFTWTWGTPVKKWRRRDLTPYRIPTAKAANNRHVRGGGWPRLCASHQIPQHSRFNRRLHLHCVNPAGSLLTQLCGFPGHAQPKTRGSENCNFGLISSSSSLPGDEFAGGIVQVVAYYLPRGPRQITFEQIE
jgi:hypothetical protein